MCATRLDSAADLATLFPGGVADPAERARVRRGWALEGLSAFTLGVVGSFPGGLSLCL